MEKERGYRVREKGGKKLLKTLNQIIKFSSIAFFLKKINYSQKKSYRGGGRETNKARERRE